MIRDRRIAERVNEKFHKMLVRPAVMYGLETLTLTKKTEGRPGGAKVFIGSDQNRHENEWFRHVQRRYRGYIEQKILKMEPPGRRKTSDEVRGCNEEAHVEGWCDRRGWQGLG